MNLGHFAAVLGLWAIPASFFLLGYYPFGLLVVAMMTVWAAHRIRRACPRCGRSWRAARVS